MSANSRQSPAEISAARRGWLNWAARGRNEMIVTRSARMPRRDLWRMQSLISNDAHDRPPGIAAVAALLALSALTAWAFAGLLVIGVVPLSYGSVLLQGGLEQSGPIAFLIYGSVTLTLAWALWSRRRWARRLTVVVAAVGVALAVPAISSAVTDGRAFAIVREGLQIIVRVAVIYYLSQEPVKDWFASRRV